MLCGGQDGIPPGYMPGVGGRGGWRNHPRKQKGKNLKKTLDKKILYLYNPSTNPQTNKATKDIERGKTMNDKAMVKELMAKQNLKAVTLAGRLGITPQTLNGRLNDPAGKWFRTNLLVSILRALDYKLVAMPREGKLPAGAYEIGD